MFIFSKISIFCFVIILLGDYIRFAEDSSLLFD